MRMNKWAIIASTFIAVVGIVLIIVFSDNAMFGNLGISLLAGAIVSLVTSCIYYAYEWQGVVGSVRAVLPGLYLDLSVIKKLTGDALPEVHNVDMLSALNYQRISGLASQAAEYASGCKTDTFSGLLIERRTERGLKSYTQFAGDVANLRSCLMDVELLALNADKYKYEMMLKTRNAQPVTLADSEELFKMRNLVNVKTAKVHEYEASLLLKLDELGTQFFRGKGESWEQIKKAVDGPICETISKASYLDDM